MPDFVTRKRTVPPPQFFRRRELDVRVEQSKSLDGSAPALHGVVNACAEHLKTSADTQHHATGAGVADHRLGQPSRAHPREIGDGGLGPGDHYDVHVGQVGGFGDPPHQHAGLTGQRLDIGRVGDPRQPHRTDPQPLSAGTGLRPADHCPRRYRDRVFGIQPQLLTEGQHPVGGPAGTGGQLVQTRLQ